MKAKGNSLKPTAEKSDFYLEYRYVLLDFKGHEVVEQLINEVKNVAETRDFSRLEDLIRDFIDELDWNTIGTFVLDAVKGEIDCFIELHDELVYNGGKVIDKAPCTFCRLMGCAVTKIAFIVKGISMAAAKFGTKGFKGLVRLRLLTGILAKSVLCDHISLVILIELFLGGHGWSGTRFQMNDGN